MASAGASCRRAILVLKLELGAKGELARVRSYGTLCRNKTWCRRWWDISQKGLSTGTTSFTPTISPILCKEQQHYHEKRESRESKDARESKEWKELKNSLNMKESKESRKQVKGKGSGKLLLPGNWRKFSKIRKAYERKKLNDMCENKVTVEYYRGLPRITLPLPSSPDKCMFTLKPITQTVGDFLAMLKQEDTAIIDTRITTINGVRMGDTNRIETLLLDDFNLVINDKIYYVSPPPHIERPKENLRQLQDLQALINQLYETFNAREYHAELEREVMLHLEEVRKELEPMEEIRLQIDKSGVRRYSFGSWGVLVLMAMQFGCLARLTWWEYSWDIMEPVTYFVTYATAIGGYSYFLITNQEYMLTDVFQREYLIAVHKKAKKIGFDLDRYNVLKQEAYELETMLKVIRGPLHAHQSLIERKRQERLKNTSSSSSSSSSSCSPSSSRSPSPSPERTVEQKKTGFEKKVSNPSAVI